MTTDFTDVCKLMVFVRTIENDFEIKKEFVTLQPLTTGTKSSDVFVTINKVVSELISFEKYTGWS
jgi:hypothetical protein